MFFDDHPRREETDEAALATLRSARALRGLSSLQLQRIETRLERRVVRRRPAARLVAAVGLAVALCAGATFAVAHMGLRRLPILGPLFARPAPTASGPKDGRIGPSRAQARDDAPAARTVDPAPASRPAPAAVSAVGEPPPAAPSVPRATNPGGSLQRSVEPRRKTIARLPDETSPVEDVSATNSILAESRSFSAAVGKWHRDRDARAALALLDSHEHRFPDGQLKIEAGLLRAEILLHEGREREALRLLDSVSVGGLPRARELQTVRGELRVKFGRCQEGRRDLEGVRAQGDADDLGRRAARALRVCP